MARTRTGNVPVAALRWSVERAGIEFGLSSHTLRKALNKESIVSGDDGCFSTAEICRAVFGGLSEEKLATQREMTEKLRLENAITKASYVNKDAIAVGLDQIADAMVQIIQRSGLPKESQSTF